MFFMLWRARVAWYCQKTDVLSLWIGSPRMYKVAVRPTASAVKEEVL